MIESFTLEFLLFLFLYSLGLAGSVGVIRTSNTVHAAFFLVLVFVNSAILLLLFEIEFIAFIFLIVYVGAIAVLFLFVVMMFDTMPLRSAYKIKRPLYSVYYTGALFVFTWCFVYVVIFILFREISIVGLTDLHYFNDSMDWLGTKPKPIMNAPVDWQCIIETPNQMEMIGNILYTNYFIHFIMCGIVLLVSMLGAIVLTFGKAKKLKSQQIFIQILRDVSTAVKLNR